MSESTAVTGWEAHVPDNNERFDAGNAVAVAQSNDELRDAIVVAHQFPRNEAAVVTRILKSCERPGFAEKAAYSFPRGGKPVTGPSVYLTREIARCMGNMRSGQRTISMTDDEVHIVAFAYDLEANNSYAMEDRFARRIQRKNKQTGQTDWVEPDERDLRELINRRGAICERNATLKLLPPDVVDLALARARSTLERAAKGDLEQNRDDAVRRLAYAFDKLGVSTAMLETYLGHALTLITSDEIAELREVYRSIEDGNSTREEHFVTTATVVGSASNLNAKLDKNAKD